MLNFLAYCWTLMTLRGRGHKDLLAKANAKFLGLLLAYCWTLMTLRGRGHKDTTNPFVVSFLCFLLPSSSPCALFLGFFRVLSSFLGFFSCIVKMSFVTISFVAILNLATFAFPMLVWAAMIQSYIKNYAVYAYSGAYIHFIGCNVYLVYFIQKVLPNPFRFRSWFRSLVIEWKVFQTLVAVTISRNTFLDLAIFCLFVMLMVHCASVLDVNDIKASMSIVARKCFERGVAYLILENRYLEGILMLIISFFAVLIHGMAVYSLVPFAENEEVRL